MLGTRRDFTGDEQLRPGEYGRHADNQEWYACSPNGLTANLSNHNVVEHDDGTITVDPSILVRSWYRDSSWHGYLRAGVWVELGN